MKVYAEFKDWERYQNDSFIFFCPDCKQMLFLNGPIEFPCACGYIWREPESECISNSSIKPKREWNGEVK